MRWLRSFLICSLFQVTSQLLQGKKIQTQLFQHSTTSRSKVWGWNRNWENQSWKPKRQKEIIWWIYASCKAAEMSAAIVSWTWNGITLKRSCQHTSEECHLIILAYRSGPDQTLQGLLQPLNQPPRFWCERHKQSLKEPPRQACAGCSFCLRSTHSLKFKLLFTTWSTGSQACRVKLSQAENMNATTDCYHWNSHKSQPFASASGS